MSYFVQMKKDGIVIEVAPPSVENHQSLGWVVVEEAVVPEAEPQTEAAEDEKAAPAKKSTPKK